MSVDPLDALLDRLTNGDEAAAQQVFVTYEPYLRMVVRRLLPPRLRPKFDSLDIVQSVWADMVLGFRSAGWHFSNPAQLRAFLIKVTRNRFIDRVRRYRGAAAHEQALSADETAEPSLAREEPPGQEMQAEELWDRMLQLCAPAHRELLQLKRQGCSLAEIAQRTGLHPSSVRRILYDLARKLASTPRTEPRRSQPEP